jgi:PIN domain nuclease of toxin-antitoxin system
LKLLLDSHVLLWWHADDQRLSVRACEAMERPGAALYFSAASIWELAIKQASGKLDMPGSLLDTLAEEKIEELKISSAHAIRAGTLAPHHRDPFDRVLIAQAQVEGMTLVTGDAQCAAYDVAVLW